MPPLFMGIGSMDGAPYHHYGYVELPVSPATRQYRGRAILFEIGRDCPGRLILLAKLRISAVRTGYRNISVA